MIVDIDNIILDYLTKSMQFIFVFIFALSML